MANPPSGFWPVREKAITLSVVGGDNIITESDLGVKPDGVFNTHSITVSLTSGSVALYGAVAVDSSGAFVWTDLATDAVDSDLGDGDTFLAAPQSEGVFKAFKLVTVGTDAGDKVYIRSSIRGL
jgi:hypothetical protein